MMQKAHIRTYRITDSGDVTVTHWTHREAVDLSKHYKNAPHDRRHSRLETALDVFRFDDGQLSWSLAPNGQDVDAAMTVRFLIGLFLEDVERAPGDPLCF